MADELGIYEFVSLRIYEFMSLRAYEPTSLSCQLAVAPTKPLINELLSWVKSF